MLNRFRHVFLVVLILSGFLLAGWVYFVSAAPDLRLAMILPGDSTQPGHSGYVLVSSGVIEREFESRGKHVEISYIEQASPDEAAEAMNLFASQGYDLVIAADDSYSDVTNKLAERYPNTAFVLLGDTQGNGKNMAAIALRYDEAGYVAGQMLAHRTQTGNVMYLAGPKTPRRQQVLEGVKNGVEDTDRDVNLEVVWDVTTAEEAEKIARSAYTRGVDIINVDADDQATLLAVYEVSKHTPDTWVSNWHIDLSPLYPKTTLGSYNAAWADVLTQAAVWVDEGRWQRGKRYSFGIRENAFNMSPIWNTSKDTKEVIWDAWKEFYEMEYEQ